MNLTRNNISIYIPRNVRNFVKICMVYAEEELDISSFSNFIILCMKEFVNKLPKEQRKKFEQIGRKIAKKEKPRAVEFVDKFIQEDTKRRRENRGNRYTKKRRP